MPAFGKRKVKLQTRLGEIPGEGGTGARERTDAGGLGDAPMRRRRHPVTGDRFYAKETRAHPH